MSDFQIQDNQNVDVAVTLADAAGHAVAGAALDASSLTATFADGTEWTVTPSADQTSINVAATGTLVTGDVLTVGGTVGGTPLTPGTLAFDEVVGPVASIVLTPGTPVNN